MNGGGRGPVRVYASLGVPRGGFALVLIGAAVVAFAVASWVEKRVSATAPSRSFPVLAHRLAAAGLLALGLVLVFLPDRQASLLAQVADPVYQRRHAANYMTAEEFTLRLLDDDPLLLVLDLRPEEHAERLALPGAIALPLAGLLARDGQALLGRRHATRVFVDEDGTRSLQAALLAERLGYENVRVLQGGVAGLRQAILDYQPGATAASAAEKDRDRFRSEARLLLAERIAHAKAARGPLNKPPRKIQGGC